MEEYEGMAKQLALEGFYKDTREQTDAKIYALKYAGIDTSDVEAEVERRRKAFEEKKRQDAEAKGRKSEVKEAGIISGIKDLFLSVVNMILEKDSQRKKAGIMEL